MALSMPVISPQVQLRQRPAAASLAQVMRMQSSSPAVCKPMQPPVSIRQQSPAGVEKVNTGFKPVMHSSSNIGVRRICEASQLANFAPFGSARLGAGQGSQSDATLTALGSSRLKAGEPLKSDRVISTQPQPQPAQLVKRAESMPTFPSSQSPRSQDQKEKVVPTTIQEESAAAPSITASEVEIAPAENQSQSDSLAQRKKSCFKDPLSARTIQKEVVIRPSLTEITEFRRTTLEEIMLFGPRDAFGRTVAGTTGPSLKGKGKGGFCKGVGKGFANGVGMSHVNRPLPMQMPSYVVPQFKPAPVVPALHPQNTMPRSLSGYR